MHISGRDGPVTAVSIPRDDYVDLSGCPGSVCEGKIKQAYGLAYQQSLDSQAAGNSDGPGATDLAAREQTAREAGRKAEIGTVNRFVGYLARPFRRGHLGRVLPNRQGRGADHGVPQRAIRVDSYSGAAFHQGVQRIDAAQAMAFVRQRRDENDGSFTDFDRTRRQQAFLVSLVKAARDGGALSSPSALRKLLQVARDNVAVDAGLDLVEFASRASQLTDRPVSFYTLPISVSAGIRTDPTSTSSTFRPSGGSFNERFFSDTPAAPTPCRQPPDRRPRWPSLWFSTSSTPRSRDGLAAAIEDAFTDRGFTRGSATTATAPADDSIDRIRPRCRRRRADVGRCNCTCPQPRQTPWRSGTVRLTVGTRFPAARLPRPSRRHRPTASASGQVTAVAATGTGARAPAPTDLSQMTATSIPCVK